MPKLTAEHLRDAGIKAFQNASDLIEEAEILFVNRRWSRVVFLCCIAGEELGKCFISLSAVMNHRARRFNQRRYEQRFRAHEEKTGILNFFEDVFVSSSDAPIDPSKATHDTEVIEKMKLRSLYCDFYEGEAFTPSELTDERLAVEVLKLAKNRLKYFAEHVRPKFDHVLEIKLDAAEIRRIQDELLRDAGQS